MNYFVMQFVLVTAGVLMALLIDNLIEVRRQNELVAEAMPRSQPKSPTMPSN